MVVQKTINSLKERPRDEKTAVATGIAAVVVALLLLAWGFWFVSNLGRGGEFDTFVGPQEEHLPTYLQGANEKLRELARPSENSLRDIRNSAVETPPAVDSYSEGNVFVAPEESAW